MNRPFIRRLFRDYNNKTKNLPSNDKYKTPIIVKSIKDVTPVFSKPFTHDIDDGACGRWGYYGTPIKLIPNQFLIIELDIDTLRIWKGYIDFRINTPEGRRVAHHRVEIVPKRQFEVEISVNSEGKNE